MIISTQRTIYGLSLQLYMLTGKPYVPLANTTLNEKFSIDTDPVTDDSVYPTINYFTIGTGGSELMDGIGGYTFNAHSPVDAALFEHLPFIIRKTDNDILTTEASKYRFKLTKTIDGVDYYCYYLKKIDDLYNHYGIHKVIMSEDGNILDHFDTNTDTLLNPVPRNNMIDSLNSPTTEYITKTAKIKFMLTATEMEEVNNSIKILYGENSGKAITEIGVCSGIDDDDSLHAYQVQVNFHVGVNINASVEMNSGKDYIRSIEISGTEALVLG